MDYFISEIMEENNSESQISLESIDKKLMKIENKINEVKSIVEGPKSTIITTFISLGIVLFSISIALQLDLRDYPEGVLWATHNAYLVVGIAFIAFGLWLSKNKFKNL